MHAHKGIKAAIAIFVHQNGKAHPGWPALEHFGMSNIFTNINVHDGAELQLILSHMGIPACIAWQPDMETLGRHASRLPASIQQI